MSRSLNPARLGAAVAMSALFAGCVTSETRPLPKMQPIQATTQIPEAELLDVGVHVFDPNIPEEIKDDPDAQAKRRIFPEVRRAEAGYIPGELRTTLESSAQWGAVRIVPEKALVDVIVDGRILESTGAKLALEITVRDSMGRTWIDHKTYEGVADLGSYKTDAALRARDPFQNVYSGIANDMLAAREKLAETDRREIRRVTELRFAADFAPEVAQGYLSTDSKGLSHVARLPAQNDPMIEKIDRIRERDFAVVDTVDGYYLNFSEKMHDSYGNFRRVSAEEVEKEERARASANMRTALGAAAILGSIFIPDQCGPSDYTCRNVQSAARSAGVIGGIAGVMSGIKKYSDAKSHAEAMKELADSFEAEVAPQVIEVEGRTLKLTGTAEEQYREWRELLRQMHAEETGGVPATPPPPVATPAAAKN